MVASMPSCSDNGSDGVLNMDISHALDFLFLKLLFHSDEILFVLGFVCLLVLCFLFFQILHTRKSPTEVQIVPNKTVTALKIRQ